MNAPQACLDGRTPSALSCAAVVTAQREVVTVSIIDRDGRTLGRADAEPDVFPAEAIRVGIDTALTRAGLAVGVDELAGVTVVADVANHVGGAPAPPASTPPWWHRRLPDDLAELTGAVPHLVGPARAAAIGELWRGAGRGLRNVLVVMLDDAVDGALLLGGRLLGGASGPAGSVAHVCVDPYGPRCSCGARGCLSAIASGGAVVKWMYRHTGKSQTLDRVIGAALRGDTVAVATIRRAGEALGQVTAGMVTTLDLDAVIVGGALAAAGPTLLDAVGDGHDRAARLPFAGPARVVGSILGDRAVEIGAAALSLEPARFGG